jgi:hypothetical protein
MEVLGGDAHWSGAQGAGAEDIGFQIPSPAGYCRYWGLRVTSVNQHLQSRRHENASFPELWKLQRASTPKEAKAAGREIVVFGARGFP